MAGDERVRHCASCDLNVYNSAEMTGEEIRELVARTEGRLCMRLYRRADGTLLTKDCPAGIRALRRRASRMRAAVTAAMLSVAAFLSGCATSARFGRPRSTIAIESAAASRQPAFSGVVMYDRAALPGVTVILRDEIHHREQTVVTDADGGFTFRNLYESVYRVEATLAGFCPASIAHLELKQNEATRARVTLQIDPTLTVTVGALVPVWEPKPNSMTLSDYEISKLPM